MLEGGLQAVQADEDVSGGPGAGAAARPQDHGRRDPEGSSRCCRGKKTNLAVVERSQGNEGRLRHAQDRPFEADRAGEPSRQTARALSQESSSPERLAQPSYLSGQARKCLLLRVSSAVQS
jgi:hypothetical protein